MGFDHRKRIPGRGWWPVFWWWVVCSMLVRIYLCVCYRLKLLHKDRVPPDGPAIYVSNHQSFIDPMALGLLTHARPFTPMVRQTLFDSRFGGWSMRGLRAIPIDREKGEAGPMKAALAELEAGRRLIIFPEGTRSRDGAMKPFKRGMLLLIKRGKAPVVPMAVEGMFDAWPPGRSRPKLSGRIMAMCGEPIEYDDLMKDGNDAALERLKREIETMRMELRRRIRKRTRGRLPAPGPGDVPYWQRAGDAEGAADEGDDG
jgi:1-acyl-sn-glycerol-3-phosphate acyltransferase